MKICVRACALLLSMHCLCLSAGVIRHDVPDANYLNLGASSDYDSVGRVSFASNSDWGTGVLLNGRWMLTAAHLVRSNAINNTPENVQFTVGGNSYTADQIILNPGYVQTAPWNGNDIALVRLSDRVNNVIGAEIYTGASELGETGIYVGFGRTGTGQTGVVPAGAAKRGGENDIDLLGSSFDVGWSSNILLSDFDDPLNPGQSSWGLSAPNPLEMLPAEKDSGSGLFIDIGGEQYLAGIVSFALFDMDGLNYSYGDAIAATRVSAHVGWITSTVPEVSVLPLMTLAAGSVLSITWLRRSKLRAAE